MSNDHLSRLEDIELMTKVREADDRAAFSCLVERYQNVLLNFFARSGVQYDIEDLVQQTFLRLYRYRKSYKPSAKFKTFLFLMARQVWIDEIRRRQRRHRLAERLADMPPEQFFSTTPVPPEEVGIRVDLTKALAQLPERLRQVIELGVYQELPYAEISKILGIPVGTVKSRMFNALAKLKKILIKGKK